MNFRRLPSLTVATVTAMLLVQGVGEAQRDRRNGTTLAASKTLDICEVSPATDTKAAVWRYSGEIGVCNEGAITTTGFSIVDCIQNQIVGPTWANQYCSPTDFALDPALEELPVTLCLTPKVYSYSFDADPLSGTIRNVATITITNHSGSIGTPKGPEPKATYTGENPPPPCGDQPCGCSLTQGYWGTHPEAWPAGYNPGDPFFLSGYTWIELLPPTNAGSNSNGYIQLARQYIAAALNQANGACTPDGLFGVGGIFTQATAFFETATPASCSSAGSCGLQKTWAAIVDSYNKGLYPGGPVHCGDESQ